MMAEPAAVTTEEVIEFICPFCGRHAMALVTSKGTGHEEPPCGMFLKLDPTEYLHEVNARLTRNQGMLH